MYDVINADGKVTIAVTGVDESNTSAVTTLIGTTGTWDVTDEFYDAAGNLTETIDGANLATAHQEPEKTLYDQFGDLAETIDADGVATYMLVDADGEVTVSISDASSTLSPSYLLGTVGYWNVTDEFYDAAGNLTGTIEGANLPTSVQVDTLNYYDQFGNVTESVDSVGDTTVNVYDADNELIRVDSPISGVTTYAYDPDGNQTEVIDPDGNATHFWFNAFNETAVVAQVDPTGAIVTFPYYRVR